MVTSFNTFNTWFIYPIIFFNILFSWFVYTELGLREWREYYFIFSGNEDYPFWLFYVRGFDKKIKQFTRLFVSHKVVKCNSTLPQQKQQCNWTCQVNIKYVNNLNKLRAQDDFPSSLLNYISLANQYSLYEYPFCSNILFKWRGIIDVSQEICPFLLCHELVEVRYYRGYMFYRGPHCWY